MSIPESELSYGSILTLTGENAEINGKLNNKPINFTHIAIGDANDVYVQPSRTQTALVNEITRIPVTGMEKITPSEPDGVPQLKVWAKIPDDIVDIAVREFAAVATFDGNSYLHAVGNSVRIPILSGSNNGGEVNDIFIEMTFAVTSLEPIVMIDPAIVTATRKFVEEEDAKHLVNQNPHPQYALASVTQFLPYNPNRFYTFGEVCYTKNENTGEITYWQWYSNLESLKGKDPLDTTNRHVGWTATDKPFYWIEYKADIVGLPFYWLDTTAPEWAVMEINVDLPSLVYWRLARRYPSLVFDRDGVSYINTGEIRAEFLRVLDQGRGIDVNRQINTAQRASIIAGNDDHDGANTCLQNVNVLREEWGWETVDISHISNSVEIINWADGVGYSKNTASSSNLERWMGAARSRNVARPMAIAI